MYGCRAECDFADTRSLRVRAAGADGPTLIDLASRCPTDARRDLADSHLVPQRCVHFDRAQLGRDERQERLLAVRGELEVEITEPSKVPTQSPQSVSDSQRRHSLCEGSARPNH
jgi:pyruvate/2-oxoacid:ferredoxin oxidoreductase beta subunit